MRQIDLLLKNPERFERAVERARQSVAENAGGELESTDGAFVPDGVDVAAEAAGGTRPLESITGATRPRAYSALKDIILADTRPAYFINNVLIGIKGERMAASTSRRAARTSSMRSTTTPAASTLFVTVQSMAFALYGVGERLSITVGNCESFVASGHGRAGLSSGNRVG